MKKERVRQQMIQQRKDWEAANPADAGQPDEDAEKPWTFTFGKYKSKHFTVEDVHRVNPHVLGVSCGFEFAEDIPSLPGGA